MKGMEIEEYPIKEDYFSFQLAPKRIMKMV